MNIQKQTLWFVSGRGIKVEDQNLFKCLVRYFRELGIEKRKNSWTQIGGNMNRGQCSFQHLQQLRKHHLSIIPLGALKGVIQ